MTQVQATMKQGEHGEFLRLVVAPLVRQADLCLAM
jgi:hypothetical protein